MAAEDAEEKVMATAQHIVKTLGTTDTMTDDMINIFSSFDKRFKSMGEKLSKKADSEPYNLDSVQDTLAFLEDKILKWDISGSENPREHSLFLCDEPAEAASYLDSVDDLQTMIATLGSAADQRDSDPELLERAQKIFYLAMLRLQEEFEILLEQHCDTVDPDLIFDQSSQLLNSNSDTQNRDTGEENDDVLVARPISDLNFIIDMMPQEAVFELVAVSKRMIAAGFSLECQQAYCRSRKMFLEESVSRLGLQSHSVEDVQKMRWEALEMEISKWIQVVKVTANIFFPSELKLCESVFARDHYMSETCFVDISKGVVTQLLNFADAVTLDKRSPERLFKILDMYETLRDLLPDIIKLFSEAVGSDLRMEISTVIMQLMESARGVFVEFENAIQSDSGKVPVPGGAVHPLTRYVMNYMRFACDYKDTLEQVLMHEKNHEKSLNQTTNWEELSPLSIQTIWIMDLLEANLESKSKMYRDSALGWLFLMNNCCYIVQKVKNSEIGSLLGYEWIRKHTTKIRQYHTNYQRASWGKILSFLKDDGVYSSGNFSSGISRAVLKEKFKNFNTMFEEIHKVQSTWTVADEQVRTELRISIAEMVVTAYRSFFGRFKQYLENGRHPEKYIKYSPEDMETFINELFEGSSGFLGKKKL